MKASDRLDAGRMWTSRVNASGDVCKRVETQWTVLEDALAGIFPRVIPRRVIQNDATPSAWAGDDDQINLNVSLSVATYMTALLYDSDPQLMWQMYPEDVQAVVEGARRLSTFIMNEGGAVEECRRAARYLMTRGSWVMGLFVDRINATPEEMRAAAIPVEQFVMAARAGTLTEIPYGVDLHKLATVARDQIENPTNSLGLMPEEKARIAALAETAEVEQAKKQAGAHPVGLKARIQFEALPMGTWFRFDPTVTAFSRARWAARKIVMTPEEFKADPAFTDEAKDKIEPIRLRTSDPAVEAVATDALPGKTLEENGRIALWEIHDKVYRKRHYVSEGRYSGVVGIDDTYPYLDVEGEPLFNDFYPFVVRTPIMHNREKPEQAFGIPYLAPGWPIQLEIIKTRSAYYNACKRAARIAVASKNADPSTIQAYIEAQDGAVILPTGTYDATKDGPLFERIDMGPAPIDFLQASTRLLADYANVERVPLAALTGEPVADTLGQEEIALKGSSVTQSDVVRSLESGYAELARKAFVLFRSVATDDEWVGYMGRKAAEPDQQTGIPLFQAIKAMGIDGRKLTAKFASSIRAEDLARQKQRMDFYALSMGPLGRDATGVPFFDGKSQLKELAREMEIEGLTEHVPSTAEIIGAALMQMQAQKNNGSEGSPGDRSTDRKAGGERGEPAIRDRQERNEAPPTNGQMQGIAQRPQNSLA